MGWIVFLLVLGILLFALELFVTPGVLIGLFGLLSWGLSVYLVFDTYGSFSGGLYALFLMVFAVSAVIWGVQSNIWSRVTVHSNLDSRAHEDPNLLIQKGALGQTLSVLRPSGTARFEDAILEVHSQGDWIPQGVQIEVILIDDNKIYVQQTT